MAIALPQVEVLFDFLGGFGAVFIAIFFPMCIHVKLSD